MACRRCARAAAWPTPPSSSAWAERREVGGPELVLLGLDRLDDSSPWIRHDRPCDAIPYDPHRSEQGSGFAWGVELEIDHDVVRVVDRAEDLIAADARLFPADGVAVESFLPDAVVDDGVFDPKDRHHDASFLSFTTVPL